MSQSSVDEQRLLDALRLTLVPGIGPRTQAALSESFGSASGTLAASRNELLEVAGVGKKLADAIIKAGMSDEAGQELCRCRDAGIQTFLLDQDAYPAMLREICDPPGILYCRGTLEPQDALAVALVGSRRCTLYGRQQAERLAGSLARAGMTVVSGLARGIDAVAHRAALAAEGRTIAVAATGLAQIYPPEHGPLAEEITQQGAVVTEFRLDQQPIAGLFPQRNRIISGMSLGVIVVEASRRSGALHTARHAMEQGREVFAVPGRIDSLASEGCHDLIRDGATLVRDIDDVLVELGPLIKPVQQNENSQVHSPRELTLNHQERLVLEHVSTEGSQIDQVLRETDLEPPRVLSTLTVLEMKRLVRRLPGGLLVRVTN